MRDACDGGLWEVALCGTCSHLRAQTAQEMEAVWRSIASEALVGVRQRWHQCGSVVRPMGAEHSGKRMAGEAVAASLRRLAGGRSAAYGLQDALSVEVEWGM